MMNIYLCTVNHKALGDPLEKANDFNPDQISCPSPITSNTLVANEMKGVAQNRVKQDSDESIILLPRGRLTAAVTMDVFR